MSNGQKTSQFTKLTALNDSTDITLVDNGQNFTISFADFKTALGVTGTLTAIGDGVPVLNVPTAEDYQIRDIESGAGVIASTSVNDGVSLSWNVAQDEEGVPLTSGLTNAQPVIASLTEGPGVQLDKVGDEIIISTIEGAGGLNQDQLIYVAKAGNDSNTGLNINVPKLTIQDAILDAIALIPSETNQIVITGSDAGNYTDAINLPEWVHLSFPNASYDGICDVSDNCIVQFRRMQRSTAGGSVIKKTTGAGFAKVAVELLIVGDAAQNGFLLNSGVAHLDAGVISVDGGIGIKAKNGSRVSFIISEVQLLNGGTGLGTQTAGGDPNSFSGNILYARDDGTGTLLQAKVSGDIINIQAGSLFADTLYDMGANTTLNVFATESGGDRIADAAAIIHPSIAGGNLTGGYLVYSDAATAGTPIAHTGGVDTILTNDELGAQTQKTFAPTGVTDVWSASGTTFDFSELSNGDMVDIRLNVTVTTTSSNQEVFINLELGQGGFDYMVPYTHDIYKLAGTRPLGSYEGIFLGDDNTRLNGGQFIFSSTEDATIIVHGWYCKIIRRG